MKTEFSITCNLTDKIEFLLKFAMINAKDKCIILLNLHNEELNVHIKCNNKNKIE